MADVPVYTWYRAPDHFTLDRGGSPVVIAHRDGARWRVDLREYGLGILWYPEPREAALRMLVAVKQGTTRTRLARQVQMGAVDDG